jgi:quercetin dioxygenase-like cupin family protein
MTEVTTDRGFDVLAEMAPLPIWDGILARAVHGERVSFAVVELAPDSHVPEHRHENEQLGVLVSGSMRFRIGDETRELAPGSVWTIPSNEPHEVTAGPQGAVAVEVFAPRREDWGAIEPAAPQPPRYP